MRLTVLLLTCVVPSLSLLPGQKKSKEDALEPGTKITETLKGNFDQKLVIDHQKYGDSGEAATERVDDEADYPYPDSDQPVQLVPNVPVSPQSPKYTLVPVKRLTTTTDSTQYDDETGGTHADEDADAGFTPTIPDDFQQEIASFRIPHVGLPGYITDPPPIADEDEEGGEETDDVENEEVPNHDHLFTNDFLEPEEFKEDERANAPSEVPALHQADIPEQQFVIGQNQDPLVPLVMATAAPIGYSQDPEEYRQIHTAIQHQKQQFHSHTPNCNHHFAPPPPPIPAPQPVRHYGITRPVPMVRVRTPYPVYRPPFQRAPPRVYVRYPRQQRPIYHHHPRPIAPHPYNRVRVMTQSYVQHPRGVAAPRPVMVMSNAEFRANKMPRKKKKKAKGTCKPKKIIKEIHFHHYDPQLSAQLAPLEGINLKDGQDYENNIKVFTKETDVEEDVKKGHDDYYQHNANMEAEMDKHKEETEHRLNQPDYYPGDYNPHYSESASGSKEYIDYNIQTDSHSDIHEPHPSHDYPTDRAFKAAKGAATASNRSTTPFPIQPGRYVKHKFVSYDIKTPDKSKRTKA